MSVLKTKYLDLCTKHICELFGNTWPDSDMYFKTWFWLPSFSPPSPPITHREYAASVVSSPPWQAQHLLPCVAKDSCAASSHRRQLFCHSRERTSILSTSDRTAAVIVRERTALLPAFRQDCCSYSARKDSCYLPRLRTVIGGAGLARQLLLSHLRGHFTAIMTGQLHAALLHAPQTAALSSSYLAG